MKEKTEETDVSMNSNMVPIHDSRIGEIADTMRNEEALSFRERIERSRNANEKKQRQRNFFDEEIFMKELLT